MKANFVTFLSPGTFLHEETTKPIAEWNTDTAAEMARDIVERHNATPFALFFTTRERRDDELDSRQVARSCTYYLGGTVETIEDVRKRRDPNEVVLLGNMERNGWKRIVVNCNSWKSVHPLKDGDVILNWKKG